MFRTAALCMGLIASVTFATAGETLSKVRDRYREQIEDLSGLNFQPADHSELLVKWIEYLPDVPADESGLIRARIPKSGPAPEKLPPPATTAQIQEWIKALNEEDDELRQEAQHDLLQGGSEVLPALQAALKTFPALDVQVRLKRLIDALEGFGPEDQGLAVKITPAKTYLKAGETVAVRIQYHNVTDFPLVVCVGYHCLKRDFYLIDGASENYLYTRRVRYRRGSSPSSQAGYVEIPPHAYWEESTELSFVPKDKSGDYSDDYVSKMLPTLGMYTIALVPPQTKAFNPNHLTKDYTHVILGTFKSDAEIWHGHLRSNEVLLTLWDTKPE